MLISARYNSLTECCTWWLNSPAGLTRASFYTNNWYKGERDG